MSTYNEQLQQLHKKAVAAAQSGAGSSAIINEPLVRLTSGSVARNVPGTPKPPTNPAVSSVRPAMSIEPPKQPTAPVPQPQAQIAPGLPGGEDPALAGSRAMMQQRPDYFTQNLPLTGPTAPKKPADDALPGAPKMDSQLEALRKQYLGTFSMSPEERAAQQRLDAVTAKAAADEAAARDAYAKRVGAINQQATLQPFLTGRQTMASNELANQLNALQYGSQAQTIPLTQQLAQLQADRQAQQKRLDAEIGFATPEKPDYKTIGEGQALVDPATGEVIYQGAEKTANQPATVQEYQYAVSQGYPKSFLEFQQEKAQASGGSAPTSYKEWQLAGSPGTYEEWVRKTGLRPLPPTQATTLSEGFQIPLVTQNIAALLDPNNKENKISLFGPIVGLNAMNPYAEEARKVDAGLRRASQVIGKFMEGGVLRKEDEEKYRKMLPNLTDKPDVARYKLEEVNKLLAAKSQQYLADYEAAGFDVSGFKGKLPGTTADTLQSDADIDAFLDSFNRDLGTSVNGQLQSVNVGGKNIQVAEPLAVLLQKVDADFYRATGKHLAINEAYRSDERQAQLYAAYQAGTGGRAAPPGQSFHGKGLAVDVANWKEAEPYLRRYGLKNDLADDKNHFSLGEFA